METTKTYHKANAIKSGQTVKVILGATFFSMAFMFIFIVLGLPMLVTIVLFLGIMFLSIFSFIYDGEYWIDEEQLEEKLTPKLKFMPFLKPQHNFYKWGELDSYLADSNLTRYSGEQHYLKLVFKTPKRVVNIGEGNNVESKATFINFMAFFNSLLADDAQQTTATENTSPLATVKAQNTEPQTTHSPVKPIKAKAEKSFYDGVWGKVLAIVFLVISALFLAIYFFPAAFGGIELKGTNSWKLWAVLIPGTIYFVNRAFFSNKK